MPDAVLVVGRTSFLARQFVEAAMPGMVRQASWRELEKPAILDGVGTLINFSFNPRLYRDEYQPELDVDLWLAGRIRDRNIRYILLSSRAVYAGDRKWNSSEEAPVEGFGIYGRNRVKIERAVSDCLGAARLLTLRLSNTIGFELQEGRRRTFMSQLLAGLRDNGEIWFDMNPFSRRDFIQDYFLIDVLRAMVHSDLVGIFNVGCGFPVYAGELAMWVLTGFGSGRFVADSPRLNDEFYLNTKKLEAATGRSVSLSDLREYGIAIGRKLRESNAK